MNTLLKQTLTASVLSTILARPALQHQQETPPDFVKRVADGFNYTSKSRSCEITK